MRRNDRKKLASRVRRPFSVEALESREMLNASPLSHQVLETIHAEKLAIKAVHAAKVEAQHAKVEALMTAKYEKFEVSKLLSQSLLKVKHHATKAQDLGPISGDGSGVTDVTYSPVLGAYNPTQLETAYGDNLILAGGNEGQGTTVAIVEELNDTSLISDTNSYSTYYNLPIFNSVGGPTMSVVQDTDLGTPASAAGSGVGVEQSLDTEMVHAMAPLANIIVVDVPATGSTANQLAQISEGIHYAAGLPGVSTVSVSYGATESSIGAANVVSQNSTYLAVAPTTNVAVTVSTGDGSSPGFPATSPNVIAIGGTSLYLAGARGRYSFETAWGGLAGAGAGGGGLSTNLASPTYQSNNGVLFAKRAIPDISAVADPVTAVSLYDSYDESSNGGDPWEATGGTSVAAPVVGGIIALAQSARISISVPTLSSAQINSALYAAYNSPSYATYFHDITMGNNSNVNSRGRTTVTGFTATTGYDEATGIGSPIANTLIPYLASL